MWYLCHPTVDSYMAWFVDLSLCLCYMACSQCIYNKSFGFHSNWLAKKSDGTVRILRHARRMLFNAMPTIYIQKSWVHPCPFDDSYWLPCLILNLLRGSRINIKGWLCALEDSHCGEKAVVDGTSLKMMLSYNNVNHHMPESNTMDHANFTLYAQYGLEWYRGRISSSKL